VAVCIEGTRPLVALGFCCCLLQRKHTFTQKNKWVHGYNAHFHTKPLLTIHAARNTNGISSLPTPIPHQRQPATQHWLYLRRARRRSPRPTAWKPLLMGVTARRELQFEQVTKYNRFSESRDNRVLRERHILHVTYSPAHTHSTHAPHTRANRERQRHGPPWSTMREVACVRRASTTNGRQTHRCTCAEDSPHTSAHTCHGSAGAGFRQWSQWYPAQPARRTTGAPAGGSCCCARDTASPGEHASLLSDDWTVKHARHERHSRGTYVLQISVKLAQHVLVVPTRRTCGGLILNRLRSMSSGFCM